MLWQYKQQIIEIILTGLALVALLIVVEVLKRRKVLEDEVARKSIHISVGFILAALPLFMGRWQVVLTNFGFFFGVLIFTGLFHVFTAVHAVRRWTIGEFLYPLATGTVALVFADLRIYSYAVLILALGDGLAGLIGRAYGGQGYKIWRGHKSLIGNLAFFIAATFVTVAFWTIVNGWSLAVVPAAVLLGLMLTLIEALLAGGFDNLAVTFAAALSAWFMLSI
jgi:phytol kinase